MLVDRPVPPVAVLVPQVVHGTSELMPLVAELVPQVAHGTSELMPLVPQVAHGTSELMPLVAVLVHETDHVLPFSFCDCFRAYFDQILPLPLELPRFLFSMSPYHRVLQMGAANAIGLVDRVVGKGQATVGVVTP